MVIEMQSSDTRRRAAELIKKAKVLVHADWFPYTCPGPPENAVYIARHRLNPEEIAADLLWSEPDLWHSGYGSRTSKD
jgi:ABC-type arginine transport system ATPase subunit